MSARQSSRARSWPGLRSSSGAFFSRTSHHWQRSRTHPLACVRADALAPPHPRARRSGVFLQLFLLPGNRAGVTRYCSRASLTPGRPGYGDASGREIHEKQKPARQNFGRRGQRSLSYGLIISDMSLEMRKTVFSQPLAKTPVIIYTD